MTGTSWNRKQLGLIVAIVTFVCAAAFLSIALAHPKPTSNGGLGKDWQCSKTAGMLTVCTKVAHARPTSDIARNDPLRLGRA